MSVLEEIRREREDLARVLKKHTGIRKIVEDLYPDSAHFIYELLQNAEDTGAIHAGFKLERQRLVFEHNGRAFSKKDIEAITDIGEGTKSQDDDKIGRFGVGFKAVFAYTESPRIWSPTFSFEISDLVLPSPMDPFPGLGGKTRFEFPFNNPKKLSDVAFAEIEAGLTQIAETTLLFLRNLESISWQIADGPSGEVRRVKHSEYHSEVLKQIGGKSKNSAHFLKFDQPVEGLERQRVAIAFALGFLPNVQSFDGSGPIAKQLKIIPARPGGVAVFFPAEKEASGLRFHLHGPFVPELSRASIKETPANMPLFRQLARLAATALHQIRDLGLLTTEFLGVLPNPQDSIPARYVCIREEIVQAMNTQPLTPTNERKHAPANCLLQAKAALKELLSEDDIKILVEHGDVSPLWAVAATQKNSEVDRFLTGLAITQWDIEQFVDQLQEKTRDGVILGTWQREEPDRDFMAWLAGKNIEWHQKLYELLYLELEHSYEFVQLNDLRIVRVMDGSHKCGNESYFPNESYNQDDGPPCVDQRVYTAGKNRKSQEHARKFLQEIGVREIDETAQIEIILEQRYSQDADIPDQELYWADLKRFVALVEKEPEKDSLFRQYYIFKGPNDWRIPSGIFLDHPFKDTGLQAWYEGHENDDARAPLHPSYKDCEISLERLARFAEKVGAQTQLQVTRVSCYSNPEWVQLSSGGGERETSTVRNDDYHIPELSKRLEHPSLALSKLVWETMRTLPRATAYLQAAYRMNQSSSMRTANSQLVHCLRKAKWIPQRSGDFVRPAEAAFGQLPEGFAYDSGWQWLKAIHFGREISKRTEENRQKQELARQLGFPDDECLERAKRFSALPSEEQEQFLAERERRQRGEQHDHEPSNTERRAERVGQQAEEAPERRSEERARAVSMEREKVKVQAGQYLLHQYTNKEGVMICQICRYRLPFKLADGSDYFEKIEFLPDLKRLHKQNYLALCPNHAAMFQYANGSKEQMREKFLGVNDNELKVVLAMKAETVYFTKTHIADLKAVIKADQKM